MTRHSQNRVFRLIFEATSHPEAFPGRNESSPKMAYTHDFRHKRIQQENIASARR
jgi:hypothetical protein